MADRTGKVMRKARFKTPLIEGHKGITAVLVPFDPEARWRQKPVQLAGRRHGWLVSGTVNQEPFTGYVGERWGRFFILLEPSLLADARVSVGDEVSMVVEPTRTSEAYRRAHAQSAVTTQPGKIRTDVRQVRVDLTTTATAKRRRRRQEA